MAQKQPQTDRQSDLRSRLFNMMTKAKPEILWEAKGLLERWRRKRLERKSAREIRKRLAYHWKNFGKLSAHQQQALDNYITTQESAITLADLLWRKGYRHGDHVLVYDPMFGSFRQRVVSIFDGEGFSILLTPGELPEWERARHVKPENRTRRKSQPDLIRHEAGWILKIK